MILSRKMRQLFLKFDRSSSFEGLVTISDISEKLLQGSLNRANQETMREKVSLFIFVLLLPFEQKLRAQSPPLANHLVFL